MSDALSSFQSVFGLAALIVGIFMGRPRTAAIWGAIVGAICAALLVALATNAGVPVFDYSVLAGRIIGGPIIGCTLLALLGYGIKRLFRRKPKAAPNP